MSVRIRSTTCLSVAETAETRLDGALCQQAAISSRRALLPQVERDIQFVVFKRVCTRDDQHDESVAGRDGIVTAFHDHVI